MDESAQVIVTYAVMQTKVRMRMSRYINADAIEYHEVFEGDEFVRVAYGDDIDELPTADVPQWIPCSERLPEDIRPVLVTWKNTDPASYYQYIVGKHFIGTAHYHRGKWYWYSSVTEDLLAEYGKCESEEFDEAIEAVAWMPLPEPYEENGCYAKDGIKIRKEPVKSRNRFGDKTRFMKYSLEVQHD